MNSSGARPVTGIASGSHPAPGAVRSGMAAGFSTVEASLVETTNLEMGAKAEAPARVRRRAVAVAVTFMVADIVECVMENNGVGRSIA